MSRYARRKDTNHNAVQAVLERRGLKPRDVSMYSGLGADIMVAYCGIFVWVEVKNGRGEMTDAEKDLAGWCYSNGVLYVVVRTEKEAEELADEILMLGLAALPVEGGMQ